MKKSVKEEDKNVSRKEGRGHKCIRKEKRRKKFLEKERMEMHHGEGREEVDKEWV